MIDWIKRLFRHSESLDDLPLVQASGSQKAIDTEACNFLLPSLGIRPPFDLNDYLTLYDQDDLAHAIVDASVDLTSSPLVCDSESDELCKFVDEFHRRIDIDRSIESMIQDTDIFGFACLEIVGNGKTLLDSTEILGLFRIDPRHLILQKTIQGRIEFFRQRPGIYHGQHSGHTPVERQTGGYPMLEQRLDPMSIVYVKSTNPLTSYGVSILEPIKTRLEQRKRLIEASVASHENHASPIIHLHYKLDSGESQSPDEVKEQKVAMQKATEKIDKEKGRWLYSTGTGDFASDPLGFSSLPDSQELIDHITASCIISAGLSPPSLGFILGQGVTSFESSARQSINNIISKQRTITAALGKLYRMLRLVETPPPGEIIVRMQEPTSEGLKDRYEAQSIDVNYVDRLLRMGLMSPDGAARELQTRLYDPERLQSFLDGPEQESNQNDPNDIQQDDAAVRALQRGTSPGNNPSGGEG